MVGSWGIITLADSTGSGDTHAQRGPGHAGHLWAKLGKSPYEESINTFDSHLSDWLRAGAASASGCASGKGPRPQAQAKIGGKKGFVQMERSTSILIVRRRCKVDSNGLGGLCDSRAQKAGFDRRCAQSGADHSRRSQQTTRNGPQSEVPVALSGRLTQF